MTRWRWAVIFFGVVVIFGVLFGVLQHNPPRNQVKKPPTYVSAINTGLVYSQDDVYLKLVDDNHYIRVMPWHWSYNPDNDSEPRRPLYIYSSGTYSHQKNQIQLNPTTHWLQIKFLSTKARRNHQAERIREFMAHQVEIDGASLAGYPAMQLRQSKGHWRIVEDSQAFLHPSTVKLPDSIEAAKAQYTTKHYQHYE